MGTPLTGSHSFTFLPFTNHFSLRFRFPQPFPRFDLRNAIGGYRLIKHQNVFPLRARFCGTPNHHRFGYW